MNVSGIICIHYLTGLGDIVDLFQMHQSFSNHAPIMFQLGQQNSLICAAKQ